MRVTLRDVASDVGLSIKTVSRVVNGDPNVAPETDAQVRAAIARLGYQPNLAARSLRSGADMTVGVVVDSVADPFFSAIVGAVEDALIDRGYAALTASTKRDLERERRVLDWLVQRNVSACIVVPCSVEHAGTAPRGIPTVYLDRTPAARDIDSVVVEDFAASVKAIEHLTGRGHERIAFVGNYPDVQTTSERLRGYRAALAQQGIAIDERVVHACCPSPAEAYRHTRELLDARAATAIFAAGSQQASGVVSAMNDWQRQHIAVVSFGDLAIADALRPALTVLDHDPVALAHDAVDLLVRRMENREAPPRQVVRELRLIERGSGELPPYDAQATDHA